MAMLRISPRTLPSGCLQAVIKDLHYVPILDLQCYCVFLVLSMVLLLSKMNNLLQLCLLHLEVGQVRSSQGPIPLASPHALQLLSTIHECFSCLLQNQHTLTLVNHMMVLAILPENEILCVSPSTGFAWRFFQMFLFTG